MGILSIDSLVRISKNISQPLKYYRDIIIFCNIDFSCMKTDDKWSNFSQNWTLFFRVNENLKSGHFLVIAFRSWQFSQLLNHATNQPKEGIPQMFLSKLNRNHIKFMKFSYFWIVMFFRIRRKQVICLSINIWCNPYSSWIKDTKNFLKSNFTDFPVILVQY